MTKMIFFTDLDGSLLDSKTYAFDKALAAIEELRKQDIPLVFCSSKTRTEMEYYREQLRNKHPFITENGGGIFIPQEYFSFPLEGEKHDGYRLISLGMPYPEIRRCFVQIREAVRIPARGFGDMTVDEVSSLTGLTQQEAERAKQREYDEPFIFPGAPDAHFLHAIWGVGLQWTQGRLFHIMGGHDKGKAIAVLKDYFKHKMGSTIFVGLGDSLNDLPMLEAVDRPVLIKKEDGSCEPRINLSGLYRTEGIGPAGWNEAVLLILRQGNPGGN